MSAASPAATVSMDASQAAAGGQPQGEAQGPGGPGGSERVILWDTHCHLADARFAPDLDRVLDRAYLAGVTSIVVVAADPDAWPLALALAKSSAAVRLHVACGLHPHAAARGDEGCWAQLGVHLRGAVALGEIGLDYHYDFAPRERQKEAFAAQLRLAQDLDLPVILHERDAVEDLLALLRSEGLPPRGGVWHCFSHGPQVAEAALVFGLHLGFGGLVTFPRGTEQVRAAARLCPAARMLLETDAPYLAPVPHRGRRNEPALTRDVLHFLSALRQEAPAALAAAASENAARLFGRSGPQR